MLPLSGTYSPHSVCSHLLHVAVMSSPPLNVFFERHTSVQSNHPVVVIGPLVTYHHSYKVEVIRITCHWLITQVKERKNEWKNSLSLIFFFISDLSNQIMFDLNPSPGELRTHIWLWMLQIAHLRLIDRNMCFHSSWSKSMMGKVRGLMR